MGQQVQPQGKEPEMRVHGQLVSDRSEKRIARFVPINCVYIHCQLYVGLKT